MKIICSWCGGLMKDGKPPISHGCCKPCQVLLLADLAPAIPAVEQLIEETQRQR